jgi:hypothetical protein
LFERDDVLLLNQFSMRWPDARGEVSHRPHPDHRPPRQLRVRPLVAPFGDAIAVMRAQRDGWTTVAAELDPYGHPASGRLTRRAPTQAVTIERSFGSRLPGYRLITDGGGGGNALAGATWADFDRRGRLLFARSGQVFELAAGTAAPRLLAHFRGHAFAPVPPPEWAQRW